jgi:imidazole glycerol-phosphate synthase subunit HisF
MLQPRIIPLLLVKNKGLVKSVNFKDYKYVGDPINAVRIFNEKKVDELVMLDISATSEQSKPDFNMINLWASECRMPLCYGGGIKNLNDAEKIFSLGVEKVALSSIVTLKPNLITEISEKVGSQSVVVVIDIKKNLFGNYEIFTHNAKNRVKLNLFDYVKKIEELGAGEIIINSIDKDGTMKGYDISIIRKIRNLISIPITVIGGAGNFDHIKELVDEFKIIGAGAGSMFVFKGKYRAVLINYLSDNQKKELINLNNNER